MNRFESPTSRWIGFVLALPFREGTMEDGRWGFERIWRT